MRNKKSGFSTEATSFACPCCNQQSLSSACTNMNHTSDVGNLDELSKAKTMGLLELSPEDEVEGEILYLQARLLDNVVAVKNSCGEPPIFLYCYNVSSHIIMYRAL